MRAQAILGLLLSATPAAAYTMTTTRSGAKAHWESRTITVATDPAAPSVQLSDDTVRAALEHAAEAWSDGTMAIATGEPAAAQVLVRFHMHDWPYTTRALAFTRLTSDAGTGAIQSAVIDVDERDQPFATGGEPHAFDLQSVLTHELGHALGLGHSPDPRATMFASTMVGDTHQRAPDADDRAGELALEALVTPAVSAAPATGCSLSAGRAPTSAVAFALPLVGSILFWLRRRS